VNLYWGDIHNHCGISYGYGSLENALAVAREHLDFCAVTGHAFWHDMPKRAAPLEFMIDFHKQGFSKLAKNWDAVRQTIESANKPHEFVTFQSYEAHSREYGDHHILSTSPDLRLVEADSPQELVARLRPRQVIAIPHHIAYVPGYRGINWDHFSMISPVVEVYSKHGCGMSDSDPYPYLHTMGPRDSRNTVRAGLRRGYHFGFVASTDHHAGYPGSYGDGRLAVLAEAKTREAIWDAIMARRTYAVTGDKIACRFRINEAPMGSEISAPGDRDIVLDIRACDAIDKIVVYKNCEPWQAICGEAMRTAVLSQTFKVRIEMGWGRSEQAFDWQGEVAVRDGDIRSAEGCFRGRSVLAPSRDKDEDADINALDNRIVEQTKARVAWRCTTFKNPSTLHPQTAAIILEIDGDERSLVEIRLNGKVMTASIGELLEGSRGVHVQDYGSEAFLVHRAIPEAEYHFQGEWRDAEPLQDCDVYDVRVSQCNGQCAWISPIFVES
jgi:hypothetical protein